MKTMTNPELRQVHVRALGRTWKLDENMLAIGRGCGDDEFLRVVARTLGLDPAALDGHAVDRDETNVVVRPWAIWG